MRTLQEKYNAIQEGKFSKDQFLVEARMQQPQLVTRYNGYKDAVQILKNRGMIKESSAEESFADYSNDALNDMMINMSRYEGNEDEIARVKSELQRRKETVNEASYKVSKNSKQAQHLKKGDIITSGDEIISVSAGAKTPAGKVEVTMKTKNGSTKTSIWGKTTMIGVKPVTEAKLTKKSFNGYDDAVQILKNRGMIQEEEKKELASVSHVKKLVQAAKDGNKSRESILAGFAGADIKYKVTTAEPDVIKWHYDKYDANLSGEIKLKPEQLDEAKLTKKSLTDYRYKPTNDMDKYPYEQILRGLRVELEVLHIYGTPTAEEYKKALGKVLKNLEKDEIFYTNQLAGHNKKVDLHDKFVDATAKNTVDTFNGMKKIKDLKESHTGNPKDKYVVRPCKNKKEPWAVWEGEERVKGFATKEQAKEYADKQNKKQGLSESVLKEGIKNLIKKALMENEEDVYEMYAEEDEIDYDDENFSDPFIDDPDFQFESTATEGQTVTFTNTNDGNKYTGTVVKDLGNGRFTFRAEDGKVYGSEGFGRNWKIKFEADGEDIFESVSLKDIL